MASTKQPKKPDFFCKSIFSHRKKFFERCFFQDLVLNTVYSEFWFKIVSETIFRRISWVQNVYIGLLCQYSNFSNKNTGVQFITKIKGISWKDMWLLKIWKNPYLPSQSNSMNHQGSSMFHRSNNFPILMLTEKC